MIRCTPLAFICLLSLGCGDVTDTPSPASQTDAPQASTDPNTDPESATNETDAQQVAPELPDPNMSDKSTPAKNSQQEKNADKPASDGLLAGLPFEVTSAEIKEGILELRQGDDTFADNKLIFFLFLDESGVLPAGESFVVKKDDKSFNHPHVHMRYKGPDDKFSKSESFMNNYEMTLKFGQEKEKGKIPFTIDLKLPDEQESRVRGEFVAEVTGFRIIDGKVDLTSDSFKTLEHIAQKYLSEKHNSQEIEIVGNRDGMFTHPDSNKSMSQIGKNIYEYKLGDGEPQIAKLMFVKSEAGWTIEEELPPYKLFQAHPLFAPHESSRRGHYSQQVVAQHLEKEFAGMEEPPFVHGVRLSVSYGPSSDFSKVRATYKFGDNEEEIQRAFVTQGIDDSCKLIREVDYDAKIDPKTGEAKSE